MIETAEKNGVLLMEAFAYLHSPFTKAVKEEIDAGTIGDVVYMESTFITTDYDISNIRMRRDTLGGFLYDLGCYNTTQILWMLEEEPERIQAIGDLSKCYLREGNFSKATRLQSLTIGSNANGYKNESLTQLALENNKLLEYLDIRQATELKTVIDLSKCKHSPCIVI